MSVTRSLALAAGAAACTAALAPAALAAPPAKPQIAKFKVSVEGVQRNSWSIDYPGGSGGCDGAVYGKGTETVRFSSRPVVVRAMVLPGLRAPSLTDLGITTRPQVKLSGRVSRQGDLQAEEGPCGGTGGGSIPRDCGTRSFRGLPLTIDYRLRARPRDQLELTVNPDEHELFRNCPSGGNAFPYLLTQRNESPMSMRLPRAELFDRSLGKIIVIGRGREVSTGSSTVSTTTSRWEVSFTRLG